MPVKRELRSKKSLCSINGKEVLIENHLLFDQYNVDGIIRIESIEMNSIKNRVPKFLTHFNMEVCGHQVENIYGLPHIIRNGYYKLSTNTEKPPLLDYSSLIRAKCYSVIENLSYENIEEHLFTHSFENIKCIDDLKKSIVRRYSKSLPELDKEEILSKGVSVTFLEVLD